MEHSLLGYQHLTVKIISNSMMIARIRMRYPFAWASPSPTHQEDKKSPLTNYHQNMQ